MTTTARPAAQARSTTRRCCGVDHHAGEYTTEQRADLELVAAFNRRLAAAVDGCRDVSQVEPLLDPDPLRWMWVDEGSGRLAEFLARADGALAAAPYLAGHRRSAGEPVATAGTAVRPSVAVAADGRVLHAWLEWVAGSGEQVRAALVPAAGGAPDPVVLSPRLADHFRPTAAFDAAGRAWVAYGRAEEGAVAVYARALDDGDWSAEEVVSSTAHPSFNQEVVGHPDGSVEICWQAPHEDRFGIFARRWRPAADGAGGAWGDTRLVSEGAEGNVWDPSVAALPDGGSAYAWAEYRDGSYRVAVRTVHDDGSRSPVRAVTGGTDYALHPSLAVTADGSLWCAFDVLTVHGHAGSGPTRLRPAASLGGPPDRTGLRVGGVAVPPELRPDIEASIRVVRVEENGLWEPAGELAPHLDVVPSGLPRLVADAAGGLTVAYRVHRRLPLMTFYWEVAAQSLGAAGWSPPTTFDGSDATLEEPAVAAAGDGVVLAWQTDGRRDRGLSWTEGFGGRECPYLLEHHGEVVWHGMHGTGNVRTARLAGPPVAAPGRPEPIAGRTLALAESSVRREARAWLGSAGDRYRVTVDGTSYAVYWGDLHRHSLVSRCTAGDEPSLEDFYRYSWDVCEYDFWAVTDHSENSSDYQWWSIQKIADLFRIDERFVPLYGFEWTGDTGHQNVIYGEVARGAPIYSAYADGSTTPDQLWSHLREHDLAVLTIPHHPGSAMVPMDWDYYDADLMRLVEVFQACRGNYEDDGCFRQYSDGTLRGTFMADGLRRGHRFGLIGSSDHGHGAAYVGAYAERLDRASIFAALHARRVFAATTRGIVADLRVAGKFMGGETVHDGPVEVECFVRGYGDLARVEVVRNGVVAHSVVGEPDLPADWLAVPLRCEWAGSQQDTDWSGSLSVGSGGEVLQTPYWSPAIESATRGQVSWVASTTSFGEVYGAQRGEVELTVLGPADTTVSLRTVQGGAQTTVGALHAGMLDVPVRGRGSLRLQPGTGGLVGLGAREHRLSWRDQAGGPAWYYLRAIQTDGEMVWSSPVWVDRPTG